MPDASSPLTATSLAAVDAPSTGAEVDDGVDVTLIRWTLSLSPLERLAVLQGFVDSVAALRTESNAASDA